MHLINKAIKNSELVELKKKYNDLERKINSAKVTFTYSRGRKFLIDNEEFTHTDVVKKIGDLFDQLQPHIEKIRSVPVSDFEQRIQPGQSPFELVSEINATYTTYRCITKLKKKTRKNIEKLEQLDIDSKIRYKKLSWLLKILVIFHRLFEDPSGLSRILVYKQLTEIKTSSTPFRNLLFNNKEFLKMFKDNTGDYYLDHLSFMIRYIYFTAKKNQKSFNDYNKHYEKLEKSYEECEQSARILMNKNLESLKHSIQTNKKIIEIDLLQLNILQQNKDSVENIEKYREIFKDSEKTILSSYSKLVHQFKDENIFSSVTQEFENENDKIEFYKKTLEKVQKQLSEFYDKALKEECPIFNEEYNNRMKEINEKKSNDKKRKESVSTKFGVSCDLTQLKEKIKIFINKLPHIKKKIDSDFLSKYLSHESLSEIQDKTPRLFSAIKKAEKSQEWIRDFFELQSEHSKKELNAKINQLLRIAHPDKKQFTQRTAHEFSSFINTLKQKFVGCYV